RHDKKSTSPVFNGILKAQSRWRRNWTFNCRLISRVSIGKGIIVTQRRPSKQNDALPETPTVLVVDDDPEVRDALSSLFRSVGLDPRLFASTAEFLQHKLPEAPCCIVLDIRLPGVGGLDFQAQLTKANIHV